MARRAVAKESSKCCSGRAGDRVGCFMPSGLRGKELNAFHDDEGVAEKRGRRCGNASLGSGGPRSGRARLLWGANTALLTFEWVENGSPDGTRCCPSARRDGPRVQTEW